MKRLWPFLALLVLASCSPFGFNPEGYEVLSEPLDIAWPKVAVLEYIPEAETNDYWKSPHETLADGGGDCEDLAIYFMYLLGKESEFIGLKNKVTGRNHAIIKYNNEYLEPHLVGIKYNLDETNYIIINTFSYNIIMKYATHCGTVGINFR